MPDTAHPLELDASRASEPSLVDHVQSLARRVFRLAWLSSELALGAARFGLAWVVSQGQLSLSARGLLLQAVSRRLWRVFGATVISTGPIPTSGLLVCNHLSYLDIVALSVVAPCVFVAKSDVRRWPVFGWFAAMSGTLFVRRESRSDVSRIAQEIERALATGALVVLFPEGTSSGGDGVLPFKSSLFASVAGAGRQIAAAAISYTLPEGDVSRDVCYWRDMTLAPHLVNLIGKRGLSAHLAFGESRSTTEFDRKQLAVELYGEVVRLKQSLSERSPV